MRNLFSLTDLTECLIRAAGLPPATVLTDGSRTLADAGLDSLAFLQLQSELADRYAVELPDEPGVHGTLDEVVAQVEGELAAIGVAA
jgi:acyl carrier protein